MSAVGKFKYTVESREHGNYAEAAGSWSTDYMGPNGNEAMAEAEAQAKRGRQVQIAVTGKRETP